MTWRNLLRMIDGIAVFGEHDDQTIKQIKRCAVHESVAGAALMADGHLGYSQPIGGVVAYRNAISPSGVGYDLGCGNKAVRTPLRGEDVLPDIAPIMERVFHEIPFGVGRAQAVKQQHELFDDPTWRDVPQLRSLMHLAQQQLGTVGSGVGRLSR